MSFTNLLTSIDEGVHVTAVASTPKNVKVVWTRDMEQKLLDILLEQVTLGRKGEGGFQKEAWSSIERRFNLDMKMNLVRDNFKNKLKTWKQAYRMMKDLRNMSGFAWNEATQCVDTDDVVWEELLKRKDFKNARVYKRQPFLYYNDLEIIVGNDIADRSTAAIAQENEDGHLFDEVTDLDNDGGFTTRMDGTPKFEEGFVGMNDYSTSVRQNASTPSSLRRTKKRKASMASSLDVICESIQDIREGMRGSQLVKVDKGETKQDILAAFAAPSRPYLELVDKS